MSLLCPVCKKESKLALRCTEVDLYRCPSCDHCFSDIDSIEVHEKYDPDDYNEKHRNFFEHPDLQLYKEILKCITDYKKDASIIDIGCGKGSFLKYIHEKNPRFSLTGLDLAFVHKADGINFIQGDVLTTQFSNRFDVVACIAIIEHLPDIQIFMNRITELCKPGGLIIIGTVNERSIVFEVARRLFPMGLRSPCDRLYEKHHLNHFNFTSVNCLLKNNNLSMLKTIYHNNPMSSVDFPESSFLMTGIFRIFLRVMFLLCRLTKRTILQTIICKS